MKRSPDTPVVITTERFTVEGKSRAGNETYFRVREFGLALDIGRCPDILISVPHIFVTHAHPDHSIGIPFYAAQRRLRRLPIGNVYVPEENVDDYREVMKIYERLARTEYALNLHGLSPGDSVPLRADLSVHTHRSTHRVTTNAYEVVSRGESVIFYTGDTDRRILELGGPIFHSHSVMIECSFTGAGDRERANRYAHIHLDDVFEFASEFRNQYIILTHFSLRDSPCEIHSEIARRCPPSLRERLRLALPEPYVRI